MNCFGVLVMARRTWWLACLMMLTTMTAEGTPREVLAQELAPFQPYSWQTWTPDAPVERPFIDTLSVFRPVAERSSRFRLRGRIEEDSLWSDQTPANQAVYGNLPDTSGLRRARVGAEGNFNEDSRYVTEIDLASGNVVLKDIYVGVGHPQDGGEFRFGHMREPFSLEGGTSSNSFAFMERSAVNTLDPARNWGVMGRFSGVQENWTMMAGLFQSGTDQSDLRFGPGCTTALTARGTLLPWYEDHGRSLMHLGLALSGRVPDQGVITISQKTQSPLLSFDDSSSSPLIPSLKIPANFQQLINAQWGLVHGSLWSQAEWYGSIIDQNGGGPVFFHGGHLDLGYFLTGEHRSYQKENAVFGLIDVQRPFVSGFSSAAVPKTLGYGGWEVTSRLAYLDFSDGNAPFGLQGQSSGIVLPQATVGVNWYLADQLRLMFDYTYSVPTETNTGTSAVSVFGTRLAMFW